MFWKINEQAIENNSFSDTQTGFIKTHGTRKALLIFNETTLPGNEYQEITKSLVLILIRTKHPILMINFCTIGYRMYLRETKCDFIFSKMEK